MSGRMASASRNAAAAARGATTRLRAEIHWLLLTSAPLTADEIAERVGRSTLYVRPRVSELVKQGRVIDSGERGRNASGMSAAKWTAR